MSLISINGQLNDRVSCSDRGFTYGDGLFETCRVVGKDIPLWDLHRKRLQASLSRLFISVDLDQVEVYWRELLKKATSDNQVLKIVITRGEGGRGYGFSSDMQPTVVCSIHQLPQFSEKSVTLNLCETRLSCSQALAGIKHLNRLDSVLIRAECQSKGWDDALAANEHGMLIETSHSNVFFKIDGRWVTPRIDYSGVKGVMREFVLSELSSIVGEIVEEDVQLNHLSRVQAAFCTNSLRGIVPVSKLDGRELREDSDVRSLCNALIGSRFNT